MGYFIDAAGKEVLGGLCYCIAGKKKDPSTAEIKTTSILCKEH